MFLRTIECSLCNNSSVNQEKVPIIQLEIKGKKNLYSCFESVTAKESLINDNQYFCDKCGKKVNAVKYNSILSLPKYLILSLRRLNFDHEQNDFVKSFENIDFDEEIVLDSLSDSNNRYCLKLIIVHIGNAKGGHYVCFKKINEKWFLLDDLKVEEILNFNTKELARHVNITDPNKMIEVTPYIFLYEKTESEMIKIEINSFILQQINSKNFKTLQIFWFIGQDFAVFFENMIGKKNFSEDVLLIYFGSFLQMDVDETKLFAIHKKMIDYYSNCVEGLEFFDKEYKLIFQVLTGNLSNFRISMATNLIKTILFNKNFYDKEVFINIIRSLFGFSYKAYNFTKLIEIYSFYYLKVFKNDPVSAFCEIFDYIITETNKFEPPSIVLQNNFIESTSFFPFYKALSCLPKKIFNEKILSQYFSPQSLAKIWQNLRYEEEVEIFAFLLCKLTYHNVKNTENFDNLLKSIPFPFQNLMKISYFTQLNLNIKNFEDIAKEVVRNMINDIKIQEVKKILIFISKKIESIETKNEFVSWLKLKIEAMMPPSIANGNDDKEKFNLRLIKLCEDVLSGQVLDEPEKKFVKDGLFFTEFDLEPLGLVIDRENQILLIQGQKGGFFIESCNRLLYEDD